MYFEVKSEHTYTSVYLSNVTLVKFQVMVGKPLLIIKILKISKNMVPVVVLMEECSCGNSIP